MGVVYLAEQRMPVQRRVALKIVRLGMASRQVVARFQAERQALAVMNHPHIAQVFDAGATPEGRPYFVMEFVDGVPITDYCDEGRLTIRQRLRLFIQVCEAIQHAHQKGVIHRDIKPSNLLVEERGGKPFPKVIDFGVAKAFEMPAAQESLLTLPGVQVGTPAYMSPEQAEMAGAVDTRSDIYSLGVILYQLLTGSLPFDPRRLRQAGFEGLRRILGQEDPPTPSERLSQMGQQAEGAARQRHRDLPGLFRVLRTDLDWIAMKAMEKEPQRRYASASELASDITRCLENRPVAAGPPKASYRIWKFVHRYKLGVAVTLALLAALMAGIAGTTLALLRAMRAEQAALQEARRAEQATDFLRGMFELSDLDPTRGKTITAREILDQGAERLRQGVPADLRLRSDVMHTIGLLYIKLMLYQEARPLLEEAFEIRRSIFGDQHLEVAECLASLGRVYWLTAINHYDSARSSFERSLAIYQSQLGDHPKVAGILSDLALVHWKSDRPDKALAAVRRAVAIREKTQGAGLELAEDLNNLALLQAQTGDLQSARQSYLRLLSIREESLGSGDPGIADTLERLGNLDRKAGELQAAQSLYEQALGIRERSLGASHPHLALSLESLGLVRYRIGDRKGAAALFERAYSIRLKTLGAAQLKSGQRNRVSTKPLLDVATYEERQLAVDHQLRIRGEKLSPNPVFTPNDLALIATAPAYDQLALPTGFTVEIIDRGPRALSYLSDLAVNPKTGSVYYIIARTRSLRRFDPISQTITEIGKALATRLAIHPLTQQLILVKPYDMSSGKLNSMEFIAVDESASPVKLRSISPRLPLYAYEVLISPSGDFYFSVPASRSGKGVYRYRGGSSLQPVITGLTSPRGLALTPEGDLYVGDSLADAVFRLPASGADPLFFGNVGGLAAGPIAIDPASGDVYVGVGTFLGGGSSIRRLSATGGTVTDFAMGFHDSIAALDFDLQGNLYALVGGNPNILYRISGFDRPSPSGSGGGHDP